MRSDKNVMKYNMINDVHKNIKFHFNQIHSKCVSGVYQAKGLVAVDVGRLLYFCILLIMFRVYRAKGLVAADMGGTSDPYCVLELDNARVRSTLLKVFLKTVFSLMLG